MRVQFKFNLLCYFIAGFILAGGLLFFSPANAQTTSPTTTEPVIELPNLNINSLVKGSDPKVYIYGADLALHWIPDEITFITKGYAWIEIETLDDGVLNQFTIGQPLEPVSTPDEIKIGVERFFADAPIMIDIARCESTYRQFNDDGSILLGSGHYIGVFQFDPLHISKANALGWDLYTVNGNLSYAKYLYQQAGTQPWRGCVPKQTPAPVTDNSAGLRLTQTLQLGDQNQEVKLLQQILNASGFTVADSGPGSSGNETTYFGSLTKAALQRFQCAQDIICSGDQASTGYGLVGPATRAALLKALADR